MFDTMKVARTIKELRRKNNMTQMNLADELAVSYQAVSNWERGNSMPDISKLGELARVFHCSIDELLGESRETEAVKRVMSDDSGTALQTIKELADVAPLLKPEDTAKYVEHMAEDGGEKQIDLSDLVELAPFLDEGTLDTLRRSADIIGDKKSLVALVPFLSQAQLRGIIDKLDLKADIGLISALAPFADSDTIDELAGKLEALSDLRGLSAIAPFLSEGVLDGIVGRAAADAEELSGLESLAPFLSSECIGRTAKRILEKGGGFDRIASIAPFMDERDLSAIVTRAAREGRVSECKALYPFLDSETIGELVKIVVVKQGPKGLKDIAPFM